MCVKKLRVGLEIIKKDLKRQAPTSLQKIFKKTLGFFFSSISLVRVAASLVRFFQGGDMELRLPSSSSLSLHFVAACSPLCNAACLLETGWVFRSTFLKTRPSLFGQFSTITHHFTSFLSLSVSQRHLLQPDPTTTCRRVNLTSCACAQISPSGASAPRACQCSPNCAPRLLLLFFGLFVAFLLYFLCIVVLCCFCVLWVTVS